MSYRLINDIMNPISAKKVPTAAKNKSKAPQN